MEAKNKNIVLFPFMAQGHIIPFLALAFYIERTRRNHSITFINTPQNIKKLKSYLPYNSSIQLVEIPFNSSDHGLPPDTENCDSIPYDLVIHLIRASTCLETPFKTLLSEIIESQGGEAPLCVIGDIFFGWMGRICHEAGVFSALYSATSAFGVGCYYSMWVNLPHKNAEGDEFYLPDFQEAMKIHKTQLPKSLLEASGTDPWSVFMSKNLPEWVHCDSILFNTVEEYDQIGLMYFKRKLGVPVWPIGPILLSDENTSRAGKETGVKSDILKEWLDSKPENSVLYISFGSMNTISQTHMSQLAVALECSGKNFIWVVRPPIGFDINGELNTNECLPKGFKERIEESGKGLLVDKWAPQVEILSHISVSAFLSHCGWNSCLEALSHGIPIIGWAMAAEQFFNVKFLDEMLGVCIELARGKTCEVTHEDIVEKINMVMEDTEKGIEMRRKTHEVQEMMKNAMRQADSTQGSSVKAMDAFLIAAMLNTRMEA